MARKFIPQELVLSVKCANFRRDDPGSEEGDDQFKRVREKVLARDNHQCQYCGFKCGKYMEVHHKDDDHNNNNQNNLITICQFCHNCQHIGYAGQMGEATLIWLPEIEQRELHHIVRSIMVIRAEAEALKKSPPRGMMMNMPNSGQVTQLKESSDILFKTLKGRASKAEQFLGTDSLVSLGNSLETMAREDEALYQNRKNFLNGFRLLPLGVRMKGGVNTYFAPSGNQKESIVDAWMSDKTEGPFAGVQSKTWKMLLK